MRTSSVILTTIAGMFYSGATSISETIDGIVKRIENLIDQSGTSNPIEIVNPADMHEDESLREKFSDKWKEGEKGRKRYEAFVKFIRTFKLEWDKLKFSADVDREKLLQMMFGENAVKNADEERYKVMNALRKVDKLYVNRSTGTLTTSLIGSKPILKNTIDGKAL